MGVVFFLLTALTAADSSTAKVLAFLACGLSVVVAVVFFFRQPAQNPPFLTPTALCLTAYLVWGGISSFYASSGKFALRELSLLFVFFLVYFSLVMFLPRLSFRSFAAAGTTTIAVFSLLSIDAASASFFSGVFQALLSPFTEVYKHYNYFEEGVRIIGIFNMPNVFGGVAALGLLSALHLALTATKPAARRLHLCNIALIALAFLCTFSMGATLCLGIALCAYLILLPGESRLPCFVLLLLTGALTLATMFFVFAYFGQNGLAAWVPLLGACLAAGLLVGLDRVTALPVARLSAKKLAAPLLIGIVLIIGVALVAIAMLLTGPSSLSEGESLRRSAYLNPGVHTLTVESSAPAQVLIVSQYQAEVMMHKETILFDGTPPATFTVPAESRVTYFNMSIPGGGELAAATWQEGSSAVFHSLPLHYTLLPASIANRLQGLRANQNAIQRFVFFRDGLRLFARAPLQGLGLGGFENAIFSVQDYYYETKYAHNHYLHVLAELGVVGFVIYLALLLSAALALVRAYRGGTDKGTVAALACCFIFILAHSAIEVVMSTGAFLVYVAVVFAYITRLCDRPLGHRDPGKAQKPVLLALGIFALAFFVLYGGNLWARNIFANIANNTGNSQQVDGFQMLKNAARLDVFETNDYMLTYVLNAPRSTQPAVRQQADVYAARLEGERSNTIQGSLAEYYFATGKPAKAVEMSRIILNYRLADPELWVAQFEMLEAYQHDLTADFTREDFIDAVSELYALLTEANATRMEEIFLSEGNLSFLRSLGII
jgi:hypothetical protein